MLFELDLCTTQCFLPPEFAAMLNSIIWWPSLAGHALQLEFRVCRGWAQRLHRCSGARPCTSSSCFGCELRRLCPAPPVLQLPALPRPTPRLASASGPGSAARHLGLSSLSVRGLRGYAPSGPCNAACPPPGAAASGGRKVGMVRATVEEDGGASARSCKCKRENKSNLREENELWASMGLSTGLYVAADATAVGSERTTEMHRLQPTTNTPDDRGSRSDRWALSRGIELGTLTT
jgi:hypothetical protein